LKKKNQQLKKKKSTIEEKKPIIEEKKQNQTEVNQPEKESSTELETPEINPEIDSTVRENTKISIKPEIKETSSRADREHLLFQRRRYKQQEDNIAVEKLGKTRLEYFDIFTIVDAVEKHNGCLNPNASESEKKWLHDYFLEILKIPMVLTSIKVLPVRLNLRGTGVPYTWK